MNVKEANAIEYYPQCDISDNDDKDKDEDIDSDYSTDFDESDEDWMITPQISRTRIYIVSFNVIQVWMQSEVVISFSLAVYNFMIEDAKCIMWLLKRHIKWYSWEKKILGKTLWTRKMYNDECSAYGKIIWSFFSSVCINIIICSYLYNKIDNCIFIVSF